MTQRRCLKGLFGLNKQKGFHPSFIQFLEMCGENLESSSVNLPSGRGKKKKIKKLITRILLGNKLQEWDFSLKP